MRRWKIEVGRNGENQEWMKGSLRLGLMTCKGGNPRVSARVRSFIKVVTRAHTLGLLQEVNWEQHVWPLREDNKKGTHNKEKN